MPPRRGRPLRDRPDPDRSVRQDHRGRPVHRRPARRSPGRPRSGHPPTRNRRWPGPPRRRRRRRCRPAPGPRVRPVPGTPGRRPGPRQRGPRPLLAPATRAPRLGRCGPAWPSRPTRTRPRHRHVAARTPNHPPTRDRRRPAVSPRHDRGAPQTPRRTSRLHESHLRAGGTRRPRPVRGRRSGPGTGPARAQNWDRRTSSFLTPCRSRWGATAPPPGCRELFHPGRRHGCAGSPRSLPYQSGQSDQRVVGRPGSCARPRSRSNHLRSPLRLSPPPTHTLGARRILFAAASTVTVARETVPAEQILLDEMVPVTAEAHLHHEDLELT